MPLCHYASMSAYHHASMHLCIYICRQKSRRVPSRLDFCLLSSNSRKGSALGTPGRREPVQHSACHSEKKSLYQLAQADTSHACTCSKGGHGVHTTPGALSARDGRVPSAGRALSARDGRVPIAARRARAGHERDMPRGAREGETTVRCGAPEMAPPRVVCRAPAHSFVLP